MSKKTKNIINFLTFIIIIVFLFTRITYLFREQNDNRYRVTGIKSGSYDIVYIGASEVHTYWQPMRAWKDKGWTSYNLSTDGLPYELTLNLLKEAQKYQSPDLYIISARNVWNYSYDRSEGYLRNITDSMNFLSFNRFSAINNYASIRDTDDIDMVSVVFDIVNYHSKGMISELSQEKAWDQVNNWGETNINKGYAWNDGYTYFEPLNTDSELYNKIEMDELQKREFCKLLDYIKQNNLNVLFVVNPYYLDEDNCYDATEALVKEYGFDYINLNDYYDEMQLDFSTDMSDKNHVNCYGAEKFTTFFENYIDINYDIEDHRQDSLYSNWNDDLAVFLEEEEKHKEIVSQIQEGIIIADENTDNLP